MSRRTGAAQAHLRAAAVETATVETATVETATVETAAVETAAVETAAGKQTGGGYGPAVPPPPWHESGPSPALLRRRERASQVRARRLLVVDLLVGALIALLGLLLAPGLAMVALFALPLLVVCLVWLAIERWRGR